MLSVDHSRVKRLRSQRWAPCAVSVLLLAAAIPCLTARADESTAFYSIGPLPDWVESVPMPDFSAIEPERAESGQFTLLVDRQTRAEPWGTTFRAAYAVTNESGVQNGSDIRITFRPQYQQLILHRARIYRNGTTEDRLHPSGIRVYRSEQDIDVHMLRGEYVCTVHFEDIRPGDIIEYAFSIEGAHPLLTDRFSTSFYLGWQQSIPLVRERILVPAAWNARYQTYNGAPEPKIRDEGGTREFLWAVEPSAPATFESGSPTWFVPRPWVQVTTDPDWQSVVNWALPLYKGESPPDPALVDVAETIARDHASPEAKALAALRFTQDDIRYLFVGVGEGTLRPHPPSEVLRRRFGDCKDKTLVLIELLRLLDIPAWPVLVNTTDRIQDWLPSPVFFDHVIVGLEVDGKLWFVDPASSRQRGSLADVSSIDFHRGLIVREGENGLAEIPVVEEAVPRQRVTYSFRSRGFRVPGSVTIKTVATGAAAERIRRYWHGASREKVAKDYLAYYAENYPAFEPSAPIEFIDDPASNRVEVLERYTIPEMWAWDEAASEYSFPLVLREIRDQITLPSALSRQAPLAIRGPTDIEQTVEIHLHEPWRITTTTESLAAAGCRYEVDFSLSPGDRHVVLGGRWRTSTDHILPTDLDAYRKLADTALRTTRFDLSYSLDSGEAEGEVQPGYRLSIPVLGGLGAWTLLCFVPAWHVLRMRGVRPNIDRDPQAPSGFGGWLLLPSLGVAYSPISFLWAMGTTLLIVLNKQEWVQLDGLGDEGVSTVRQVIFLLSAGGSILLTILSIVLLIVWFRRRMVAPFLYIGLMFLSTAFTPLAALGIVYLSPEEVASAPTRWASGYFILGSWVGLLIWVPYMLVSRRVRNTFIH